MHFLGASGGARLRDFDVTTKAVPCEPSCALKWRIVPRPLVCTISVLTRSSTLHRYENMGCNDILPMLQPPVLRVATNIAHVANEGTIRPF